MGAGDRVVLNSNSVKKQSQLIEIAADGASLFRAVAVFCLPELRNFGQERTSIEEQLESKASFLIRRKVCETMREHLQFLEDVTKSVPYLTLEKRKGKSYKGVIDRIDAMEKRTEPAGTLEIIVLSYLMGRQFKIYSRAHFGQDPSKLKFMATLPPHTFTSSRPKVLLLYSGDSSSCRYEVGHFDLLYTSSKSFCPKNLISLGKGQTADNPWGLFAIGRPSALMSCSITLASLILECNMMAEDLLCRKSPLEKVRSGDVDFCQACWGIRGFRGVRDSTKLSVTPSDCAGGSRISMDIDELSIGGKTKRSFTDFSQDGAHNVPPTCTPHGGTKIRRPGKCLPLSSETFDRPCRSSTPLKGRPPWAKTCGSTAKAIDTAKKHSKMRGGRTGDAWDRMQRGDGRSSSARKDTIPLEEDKRTSRRRLGLGRPSSVESLNALALRCADDPSRALMVDASPCAPTCSNVVKMLRETESEVMRQRRLEKEREISERLAEAKNRVQLISLENLQSRQLDLEKMRRAVENSTDQNAYVKYLVRKEHAEKNLSYQRETIQEVQEQIRLNKRKLRSLQKQRELLEVQAQRDEEELQKESTSRRLFILCALEIHAQMNDVTIIQGIPCLTAAVLASIETAQSGKKQKSLLPFAALYESSSECPEELKRFIRDLESEGRKLFRLLHLLEKLLEDPETPMDFPKTASGSIHFSLRTPVRNLDVGTKGDGQASSLRACDGSAIFSGTRGIAGQLTVGQILRNSRFADHLLAVNQFTLEDYDNSC